MVYSTWVPAAPHLDLAGEDVGLGRERTCEGRWKDMEELREELGTGPGTNFPGMVLQVHGSPPLHTRTWLWKILGWSCDGS